VPPPHVHTVGPATGVLLSVRHTCTPCTHCCHPVHYDTLRFLPPPCTLPCASVSPLSSAHADSSLSFAPAAPGSRSTAASSLWRASTQTVATLRRWIS
jgi:hypothetical protein